MVDGCCQRVVISFLSVGGECFRKNLGGNQGRGGSGNFLLGVVLKILQSFCRSDKNGATLLRIKRECDEHILVLHCLYYNEY